MQNFLKRCWQQTLQHIFEAGTNTKTKFRYWCKH